MLIPRRAAHASGSAGCAPTRHRWCRRYAPPPHPAIPDPANTSLESFSPSGAPAFVATLSSAKHLIPPPRSLPLRPSLADAGLPLRKFVESPAKDAFADGLRRQKENSARCGLRPAASPASRSPRVLLCAPRRGSRAPCASPRTPRTPRQNPPAAFSRAQRRPVPARCPPALSRIAGWRTSIWPPLQALHKAVNHRFLHRRRHLLGHERLRAVHGHARRQFLQFHACRALRRFDFCLGRRMNLLHVELRYTTQPFQFCCRVALRLRTELRRFALQAAHPGHRFL